MQLKNCGQRNFGSAPTVDRNPDKTYYGCKSSADLERKGPAPKPKIIVKQKKELVK